MECYKRRWGVIYEGDVGSAWEWCQIKLHTSCDVPAPLNHLRTTVVDDARSIFAHTVVVINKFFEFFKIFHQTRISECSWNKTQLRTRQVSMECASHERSSEHRSILIATNHALATSPEQQTPPWRTTKPSSRINFHTQS